MSGDHAYGPRTRAWQDLEKSSQRLARQGIATLFRDDPARFSKLSVDAEGFLLDLSRQRLDADTLQSLLALAEQAQVGDWIRRMFAGEHVNNTEDRPALHLALRRPAASSLQVGGRDVMPDVEAERAKMRALAQSLEAGTMSGYTGKRITDIVNIGIGGSDLGIAMAVEALAEYRLPSVGVHFISNIDGVDLEHVLKIVDPETTLFVICSKSFTTLETLTNAMAVRLWLLNHGGEAAVAEQCVAVSTNHKAMDAFGIAPDKRLAMWDWVGGRFSLWSAVGLTIALAIGWRGFEQLLAGAHAMDEHFLTAPFEQNLPVLLALVGIWNRNFIGAGSHAVLPYDDHLARFPAFLQQLEMESNGKSVRRNGEPVECATCPVVWGEPGSNAQHSFYQLLHQGTDAMSIDFILPRRSGIGRADQHELAIANCLAQTWALAAGDPAGPAESPHQRYSGGRGSTLLLFDALDPTTLGRLVALYEHKVYVQGIIWDVNSFDQYGVELGKRLAAAVQESPADAPPAPIAGAIGWLRSK
ncbi:MAG TPA: glucose-6-phosphate isomerase [Gammaproteobacteria bacterium]|nr:glucose-6-phosphate isomerase [Gammaproteobacteria bacterium]